MLAIEFSFLQPHFFSTDIQDPARAEWPPHPDRVFAALVQAAYASEDPEEYRPVLQWVGRLAPPAIAAPEARSWNDCTQFVPCKLSGVPGAERYLKTAKRDHSVTLDGLNLAYCWGGRIPRRPAVEASGRAVRAGGLLGFASKHGLCPLIAGAAFGHFGTFAGWVLQSPCPASQTSGGVGEPAPDSHRRGPGHLRGSRCPMGRVPAGDARRGVGTTLRIAFVAWRSFACWTGRAWRSPAILLKACATG